MITLEILDVSLKASSVDFGVMYFTAQNGKFDYDKGLFSLYDSIKHDKLNIGLFSNVMGFSSESSLEFYLSSFFSVTQAATITDVQDPTASNIDSDYFTIFNS